MAIIKELKGSPTIEVEGKSRAFINYGETVEAEPVLWGRVATVQPEGSDISSVEILTQPAHGRVSVNPDNTIALVLTGTTYVGEISFDYEVTDGAAVTTEHTATIDVVDLIVNDPTWLDASNLYMLETDANDMVVVEPGEVHRKVYVSPNGLTAADIATLESVSEATVTASWLRDNHPEYGSTEALALESGLGLSLWDIIIPAFGSSSNWLFYERGHTYAGVPFNQAVQGESPLHPLFLGAWGEGDAPILSDKAKMVGGTVDKIVVQGLQFSGGLELLDGVENWILDSTIFNKELIVINTGQAYGGGFTARNSIFRDVVHDEPVDGNGDGIWDAHPARKSGMYVAGMYGMLLDKVFFDHNGWADDFELDGSITGGHPPTRYSHNIYYSTTVLDVVMRDSINMRASSDGAQFRAGAFIEDSVFADNNVALTGNAGAAGVGNYNFWNGNLVTQAQALSTTVPGADGGQDWGLRVDSELSSLIDNMVVHVNDPDDPGDTVLGNNNALTKVYPTHVDDTIIYRWDEAGIGNVNVDGLDEGTMNTTTIQRYTADLLGVGTATTADLTDYLRGLDGTEYRAAVADILEYFRDGFGIATPAPRATAATLRFIPDTRGDGVWWDNRVNWDTGDLPGTVVGDSVDLGGNWVQYGTGTLSIVDLDLGPDGKLTVSAGKLTITGDITADGDLGRLATGRGGQFWFDGYAGAVALDIAADGGRVANTGDFTGPADMAVSGDAEVILASDGGSYTVPSGSSMTITGATAKVGFDGDQAGAASLTFAGDLSFVAADGDLGTIREFSSGAYGALDVDTTVNCGGALAVDLTGVASGVHTLIEADAVSGTFASTDITGGSGTIGYTATTVTVTV